MQRVDSFGTATALPTPEAQLATPGYYSVGDPTTATPATVVPAWWLNMVQESIMQLITSAGLTPSKTTPLLQRAIAHLTQNFQEPTFSIANNQVTAADVTNLVLDKTTTRSAVVEMSAYRKDASQERLARVKLDCLYRPVLGTWELIISDVVGESLDDLGLDFFITSAGQIQYKSSNYAGGTYVGELRAKINRFKI